MRDIREMAEDDIYEEFWKPLIETDGKLDMELLRKELYDFYIVIEEVSKVYCHITGNQISKPLTSADAVISVADEYYDKICLDHIEDMKGE